MFTVRKAAERGHFNHGWLDTYHTFSFDQYHDPQHMGFRHLRVINEDRIAPDVGFPTHPHRNMEIITYILDGALEHRDSMGNAGVIWPGEVQKMSAGRGITHSESNPSPTDAVHLLQIWILPDAKNLDPYYQQIKIERETARNTLTLFGSPSGGDGLVTIHQDVKLFVGMVETGQSVTHELAKDRHAWIQIARGNLSVNGRLLQAGDGVAISEEKRLDITAESNVEFLLFDMS